MNTIKFQPITKKRTETHNVEVYSINKMKFEEKEKLISSEAGLSIYVTNKCNARCDFCMNMYEDNFLKCRELSDEKYFERLNYILDYLKPIKPAILITGGETTKSIKLPRILKLVKEKGYKIRSFATNGSGLLDRIEGKTVLQHMLENNAINNINISRMHYNEEKNRNIMNYKKDYCSNDMLAKIIPYAIKNNLRPRMSCLLLKDGVHTVEEMVNYMDYFEQLGVDNVIFRELMDYDQDKMINKEKMDYCKNNKVRLNDVWPEIDKDKRFVPIKNILGYYYYVEIYKYHNITMCSESANLVQLYKEKEKHKDIVYEMVFHPNGNLNGSWVDNEEILLPYKNK